MVDRPRQCQPNYGKTPPLQITQGDVYLPHWHGPVFFYRMGGIHGGVDDFVDGVIARCHQTCGDQAQDQHRQDLITELGR